MHTHFFYFFYLFYFSVFFFFDFFRTKLHTCMHKPVRSELNWPMYSTHAIIIAKEREMKNLPVQGAKSKTVACFGSLGFSSLLWFFSSFNFLGSAVLSCIFLSASVFVLLRSAPCVVPPVLLSGSLYSSAGSLSFLQFSFFLLCFGHLLWFSSRELRFWCSCCWRWRPGILGVLDRRKEACCCSYGPRLLKIAANTQEMNMQLFVCIAERGPSICEGHDALENKWNKRSCAGGLLAELSAWGRSSS